MDKVKGEGQEVTNETAEKEESFAALFAESLSKISTGQTVKGVVVRITSDAVLLDIGHKSDAMISIDEFRKHDGSVDVKVGETISAVVERVEGKNGLVVLSKTKAAKITAWENIIKAHDTGGYIEGTIIAKTKGGMFADICGIKAFIPGSHIDVRPVKNVDDLVGTKSQFKVISYNQKGDNVVVSRKSYLETQRGLEREKTMEGLAEGAVLQGVVKNVLDYGAFVDIGGVDGLLHVNDISWKRVAKPSDVLKPGDKVSVKVLRIDPATKKISLGMKQATKDPWLEVSSKYTVGTKTKGKVVNLTDFGAFVELEEGVEGLIHVSEMSWTKKIKHPSALLTVGEMVEVAVIDIDMATRKMALGLKQTLPNPWEALEKSHPAGSRITGKIRTITDFGVFVGVEEGIDGLVHLSDVSWTKKIKHPSEVFKVGDDVETVVLHLDRSKEKLSLGIKQLQKDPWLEIPAKYPKGAIITGKVTSVTDFGVFVEIEEGIEGLIRGTELVKDKEAKPTDVAKVGDTLSAKVLGIDTADRKISLSVKAIEKDEEKAAIKEFFAKQGSGKASLGDILGDKLGSSGK